MCTHHIIDRGPFLYITQCTLCRRKPCVQKRLSQRRERGEMAAVSLPLTEDELLGTVNDILQRRATCHIQDCHAGLIRPETVVLAVNFVAAAAAAARVLANLLIERLTAPEQLSKLQNDALRDVFNSMPPDAPYEAVQRSDLVWTSGVISAAPHTAHHAACSRAQRAARPSAAR